MGAFPEWDQGPLDDGFEMHRHDLAEDPNAFLAEVGPRIRGIATRGDLGAGRTIIDACPALEVIAIYGVGFDAVDLDACRARGIVVANTPDVLTKDVADFGVAMMLALGRGLIGGDHWVRSGQWAEMGMKKLQRRVWGSKAGILGLGRIGHEIGRRLEAFDMEISYSARAPKDHAAAWTYIPDPVELAAASDYLFVTLAASAETRHIVGREVIEAVGPEGIIINVSRASNIDEDALIAALSSGALGGAALDVFEGEPNIDPRFFDLPNALLQPHQGSGTVETRKDMGKLMRDNLTAHFAGEPLPTPVPEDAA
ncbi:2-hydroxyacid dehydrogenase [Rhodosalinus sp.]|uniref:2-hydroxyacid dehydrogenase n=1 Tax=Rhodosalinus sp. TaxID=2047741 RepID=UPI00398394CA